MRVGFCWCVFADCAGLSGKIDDLPQFVESGPWTRFAAGMSEAAR